MLTTDEYTVALAPFQVCLEAATAEMRSRMRQLPFSIQHDPTALSDLALKVAAEFVPPTKSLKLRALLDYPELLDLSLGELPKVTLEVAMEQILVTFIANYVLAPHDPGVAKALGMLAKRERSA